MKSTISSKGQITVPVEIRDRLGLRPGTPVIFEFHPRGALLRKGILGGHPVDSLFGCLRAEESVDRALEGLRGAGARRRPSGDKGRRPR